MRRPLRPEHQQQPDAPPRQSADVLAQPRADQFDLLAHIAFGKPIRTRDDRADAFVNREQRFLEKQDPGAREVVLALLTSTASAA